MEQLLMELPGDDIFSRTFSRREMDSLFKSILKMKSMSREKLIDYLLIKCLKT